MKNAAFQIRLYVLVPVIFCGLVVLATLVTYQVTLYCMRAEIGSYWPVAGFGLLVVLLTTCCGFLIIWLLVRPVEDFVTHVESLGTGSAPAVEVDTAGGDQLARFRGVLTRVTRILTKVEVREMFPSIVGDSRAMREVLSLIKKVAPSDASVLVLGESGSGKELVARSVHEHSERRDGPFIVINCAGIPESLWESELFGHERGAFTGAVARKLGRLELAAAGTVFLDEIGDMPRQTQSKILRVLQEREIERVGGTRSIKIDVRFITATNRDINAMIADGSFRQDLYFRISGVTVSLPPLRDRREDIPLLVNHFLAELGRSARAPAPAVMRILAGYSWPGNVRELRNVVETAAILADDTIGAVHLPALVVEGNAKGRRTITFASRCANEIDEGLDTQLARMEKEMIVDALARVHGVQSRAAKLLGIKERSLWHRVAKYGIDVPAMREHDQVAGHRATVLGG